MLPGKKPVYTTRAQGKWILAGEHAVLRGCPALVFPVPSKSVELFYYEDNCPLDMHIEIPYGDNLLGIFWSVLEESLKLLEKKLHDLSGQLFFKNNIPIGAGLGFSAAFCVSLARFFQWKRWLAKTEGFAFAKTLEHAFHGQSSGVDIAGSLHEEGVYFCIDGTQRFIKRCWTPPLYLSYSGHASITSRCVQQVNEYRLSYPEKAKKIDENMKKSVWLAVKALRVPAEKGQNLLKQALEIACGCFDQWGLIHPPLASHLDFLKQQGACAVKPTGAGSGGYVLSLWDRQPFFSKNTEMMTAFL